MQHYLEAMITTLENNVSLNGTCGLNTAIKGKVFYQDQEISVRVLEVTIVAVKRLNRL